MQFGPSVGEHTERGAGEARTNHVRRENAIFFDVIQHQHKDVAMEKVIGHNPHSVSTVD
jgi:hypothetical protein